jgi:hypothetical protein
LLLREISDGKCGNIRRELEEEWRFCNMCWWESLREKGHWGDKDVDGRIILRWIFRKMGGSWGMDEVGS